MDSFEKLYKELSIDDKISLLKYERGVYELLNIGHYEEAINFPSVKPKADYLYISNVLDLDFGKFYKSKKTRSECIKYKDRLIALTGEFHIGDALATVVYDFTKTSNKKCIDAEMVKQLDTKLIEVYAIYQDVCGNKQTFEYEECGEYLGEKVYRKVLKK